MNLKFRYLRADEVECRVSVIRQNGLSLLLYKDARCDMNILDETVGAMFWERSHSRENANCTVRIWDDQRGMWVAKEDTGTESNTEKEKGLASDSFKRACFNWGIGRELYTAPFIWISADDCKIVKGNNGKDACYDRFVVSGMEVEDGKITYLTITNNSTKKVVFTYGKQAEKPSNTETHEEDAGMSKSPKYAVTEASQDDADTITDYQQDELIDLAQEARVPLEEICKAAEIGHIRELPARRFLAVKKSLEKRIENRKKK